MDDSYSKFINNYALNFFSSDNIKMLIIISLTIILMIFICEVLYILTYRRAFKAMKSEYAIKRTWIIWLTLIPYFGFFWVIYLTYQVKKGTTLTLKDCNSKIKSNGGFYWLLISYFCLLFYYIVLFTSSIQNMSIMKIIIMGIFSLLGGVFLIMHWIELFQVKTFLNIAKENAPKIQETEFSKLN
ncbi:hypothetical protein AXG55_06050 [Silvanigrella aquatica]|uniref:DUF4328 domain-containing protein n=1 Tax=Silvanigrella aquatica TaxID=1915309 RepID=A0A1L4CZW7_9BACT|nr:hypothetical protein AXG55_06050 [Silvanigrella aquatica]